VRRGAGLATASRLTGGSWRAGSRSPVVRAARLARPKGASLTSEEPGSAKSRATVKVRESSALNTRDQ